MIRTVTGKAALGAGVVMLATLDLAAAGGTAAAREPVIRIVALIQRADYEGDRPALRRLHDELTPFVEDKDLGSRVNYWRGFALWRRAQNGMNESVDPAEAEKDLSDALKSFKAAAAADPAFIDAMAGAISCLGNTMYLQRANQTRLQELMAVVKPMVQQARTVAPENPRLIWVLGPNVWNTPSDRGGGQDKAIASYEQALELWRKQYNPLSDPLEPTWGEAELYMSLAWSHLNRSTPDLAAAERYARMALNLVPYWHYTKDILLPQIGDARAKQN